jgi:DNA-binding response OmpR family regulator
MSNIISKRENTVLIISTDLPFRAKIRENLNFQNFRVFEADTQSIAFGILENNPVGVVFLDLEHMPLIELDIVSYIRTQFRSEIVVLPP